MKLRKGTILYIDDISIDRLSVVRWWRTPRGGCKVTYDGRRTTIKQGHTTGYNYASAWRSREEKRDAV